LEAQQKAASMLFLLFRLQQCPLTDSVSLPCSTGLIGIAGFFTVS